VVQIHSPRPFFLHLPSHTLDRGSILWASAVEFKSPALEKASRTGHPKFKLLTQSGRTGVVLDRGPETTLWNPKGRATRPIHAIQDSPVHQYNSWGGWYTFFTISGIKCIWHDLPYNDQAEAATEAYLRNLESNPASYYLAQSATDVIRMSKDYGGEFRMLRGCN
jgi:hypothetical protein